MRLFLLATACLLTASAVQAGPITATCEGWLTQDQFDARGSCTWSMDVGVPFYAFHEDVASYGSSFANEEFSYTVQIADGRQYVTVLASAITPRCGRRQFDAGSISAPAKSLGLISLNSCISYPPNEPPIEPPYLSPQDPQPPNEPPQPVPEAASVMLLAMGLQLIALVWQFFNAVALRRRIAELEGRS